MKSIVALAFASTLAIAPFGFAAEAEEHAGHHPDTSAAAAVPDKPAQSADAPNATGTSMGMTGARMDEMCAMHEKMMAAKTQEERAALMAEHMKRMPMMQGGMNGKASSMRPMSRQMMQRQLESMQQQMNMMKMMMRMMMDRMPQPAPAK